MARDFDGTDDEIYTGNSVFGSKIDVDSITFAGWVNIDSNSGVDVIWCTGTTKSAGNIRTAIEVDSTNAINFNIPFSTTSIDVLTNNNAFTSNTWFHLACTSDGTDGFIYINGVEASYASQQSGVGSRTTGQDTFVTGENVGGGQDFNGQQAYTTIFSRQLGVGEINLIMHYPFALLDRTVSCQLLWPLWGDTSPEIDYSGNGFNGTVSGATDAGSDNPPILGLIPQNMNMHEYTTVAGGAPPGATIPIFDHHYRMLRGA